MIHNLKEMSIDALKILGYDHLETLAAHQKNLQEAIAFSNAIEQEIKSRELSAEIIPDNTDSPL